MWNSDTTLSSPPFGALVVLNIPRFPPHSSIFAPSHNPPSPTLFGALVLQTSILIFEEEKKAPSYLLMSGANVCKWCQKQEVAASLQKLRKVTFSAAILGTNSNKNSGLSEVKCHLVLDGAGPGKGLLRSKFPTPVFMQICSFLFMSCTGMGRFCLWLSRLKWTYPGLQTRENTGQTNLSFTCFNIVNWSKRETLRPLPPVVLLMLQVNKALSVHSVSSNPQT